MTMISAKVPRSFRPGDCVVFTAAKHSAHPGPRAKEIRPELHGEGYVYVVDKFWVVTETRGPQVLIKTRKGKTRQLDAGDPHLHRASWWERLIYRRRFPRLEDCNPHGGVPA
jgi:hypothetical protein